MEMVWRGSRNYEEKSQIFTGVLYNGYNPPPGFCYDEFCEDPPIMVSVWLFVKNLLSDQFYDFTIILLSIFVKNGTVLSHVLHNFYSNKYTNLQGFLIFRDLSLFF